MTNEASNKWMQFGVLLITASVALGGVVYGLDSRIYNVDSASKERDYNISQRIDRVEDSVSGLSEEIKRLSTSIDHNALATADEEKALTKLSFVIDNLLPKVKGLK